MKVTVPEGRALKCLLPAKQLDVVDGKKKSTGPGQQGQGIVCAAI
jgi:hypothetical protein